jgi:hypothetical protein
VLPEAVLRVSPSRADELDRLETIARKQGDLARGLRQLRESESWTVLRASMLAARQKVMEAHTKALLKGEPVNQRQLDYDRGYWDGIIQMLEAPWRAQEAVEKTLERIEKTAPEQQR